MPESYNPTHPPGSPTCDVCGLPADEIARGTYWRHPRCVRLVASRAAADEVAARWAYHHPDVLPDPAGGYVVTFPGCPGCVSQGETAEEAIANGREALAAWLEAGGRPDGVAR